MTASRPQSNPITSAGLHLRRGMLVLWQHDDGHFCLVRLTRAEHAGRQSRSPSPLMAEIDLLNGTVLRTPIDRLSELPRHDPAYRRRRAFRFRHTAGARATA